MATRLVMWILFQLITVYVFGTLYHTDEIMGPEGAMYYVRPFSHNETVEHYLSKLKKNNEQLLSLRIQMGQLIMENKQIKIELLKLNAHHYAEDDVIQQLESNNFNETRDLWNDGAFIKCLYHQKTSSKPTNEPTLSPTNQPTISPTVSPTVQPSQQPTNAPTQPPTPSPTHSPSNNPTKQPTHSPTLKPTRSPTLRPTKHPTMNPTISPTKSPTVQWDVAHVKSPLKGKNKKTKSKSAESKALAETSKNEELLLNEHKLSHQNFTAPIPKNCKNSIEIQQIAEDDAVSFKSRVFDIIAKNHTYDCIITKYDDPQFMNSSVQIVWYFEKIDAIFESLLHVYTLLLVNGPTIQNLRKFGDLMDLFNDMCNNQIQTSTKMKEAVIEMKLKSEHDAKILILRKCQALFLAVYDIKILRAKTMSTTAAPEYDKRRARLQMIFDEAMKAVEMQHRSFKTVGISEYWEPKTIYVPSLNNLKKLVQETNVLKEFYQITYLLNDWRFKNEDIKKFKICVIVSTASELLVDQLPKWNNTAISRRSATLDQKKSNRRSKQSGH